MSYEITGKLAAKYDTNQVSEKFKKREFVLEIAEEINGNTYTNYAKLQLVQNKCDIIDRFNLGDNLKVSFNVKGNRWEKDGKVNFITNLDAWRVEAMNEGVTSAQQSVPSGYPNVANNATPSYSAPSQSGNPFVGGDSDDLPF